MDDDARHHLIQQKLADGRLPTRALVQLWRGRTGDLCSACEETITVPAVTLQDLTSESGGLLPLHLACFLAWDDERRRAGPGGGPEMAEAPNAPHNPDAVILRPL